MDYRLSVTVLFNLILLANARTETDDTLGDKPWFWSILTIIFALIAIILTVLIILSCIHCMKQKFHNRSNGSDYPSPPPPYPICERPTYLFMTSSPPPPYSSLPMEKPITIISPTETLDSSSIQTFQA